MLGLEMLWWLPPQLLCRLHLRRIVKRQTASGSDELLGAICFGQFLSPNDLKMCCKDLSLLCYGELLWICIICIDANTAIVTLLGCVEKYNKLVHVWISLHIIFSCATRKYLRKNHKLRLLSSGNLNFLYHIQTEGVGTKRYGVTGESLFDLEGGKDCTNSTLCIAVKM